MSGSVLHGEGLAVSFSNREVTAWGGLALFKPMLDSMAFRVAVAHWGLPEPKSSRGYAPLQLIEQFIVSIGYGACRFSHAETVRIDSTLVRLFGWTKAAGRKAILVALEGKRIPSLHGLVLAIGGPGRQDATPNRRMLSVPRRKRSGFSGLWANASAAPAFYGVQNG